MLDSLANRPLGRRNRWASRLRRYAATHGVDAPWWAKGLALLALVALLLGFTQLHHVSLLLRGP